MFSTKNIILKDNEFVDGDFFENLTINNIRYIKIDEIEDFLKNNDLSKLSFDTLITHNGDKNITDNILQLAFSDNSNIKQWFGQNIASQHKNLTCIPIGLERRRWYPYLNKQQQLKDFILSNKTDVIPSNLCYANFSIDTNNKHRTTCLNNVNASFCTNNIVRAVKQQSFSDYTQYLNNILNHSFVLCPEGNGIDTHRMWETLYLGRIPVVTKNLVNESFKDLPILILNNWNELNRDILINFKNTFNINNYSLEKLSTTYWKNKIYGTK